MTTYTIEVIRGAEDGRLTFTHGTVSVDTTCWWKLDNAIAAKTYTGCSATTMATKKNSSGGPREAVYLPDAQTGKNGIFIHYGKNASWSDGCIVLVEAEMLKIYNAIAPKNGANVTVVVKDKEQATTRPRLNYPSGIHFGPGQRCTDFLR